MNDQERTVKLLVSLLGVVSDTLRDIKPGGLTYNQALALFTLIDDVAEQSEEHLAMSPDNPERAVNDNDDDDDDNDDDDNDDEDYEAVIYFA